MTPNERRQTRAKAALKTYIEGRGEVFECSLAEMADLIADLCHLAIASSDQSPHEWESNSEYIVRLGEMHFSHEFGNSQEDTEEPEEDQETKI